MREQLQREGLAQRDQHIEQLKSSGEQLVALFKDAEGVATNLKTQAEEIEARLAAATAAQAEAARMRDEINSNLAMQVEETEAHIAERADAVARTMDEAARVREEALGRLKAQAAQTEAQIAESGARAVEENARVREQALAAHWQALRSAGDEIQQQVSSTLSAARQEWEGAPGAANRRGAATLANGAGRIIARGAEPGDRRAGRTGARIIHAIAR